MTSMQREGFVEGIFTILTHTTTTKHGSANPIKGLVAHLLNYREDCLAFWVIIPPLLIVPSLACFVTSLSLCLEP